MSEKEFLQVQILETQRLLEQVKDHPIMSVSYADKLKSLQEELEKQK